MPRYLLTLEGFDAHVVDAKNASGAKYRDWQSAKEMGWFTGPRGFREYLSKVSCVSLDKRSATVTHSEEG